MFKLKNKLLLILFFIFFSLSTYQGRKIKIAQITIPLEDSLYNIKDDFFYFHFGQKRLISALIWTKTHIDADLKHYKKKDLGSWMFLRFKSLVLLDPNFIEPYRFGALYLSVVKDDIKGASHLFELGAKRFPDDYSLQFYGGYHFLHEENNPEKALKYFQRAEKLHPKNLLIKKIVTRLMKQSGETKEVLIQRLLELIKNESNPKIKEIFEKKIKEIKKESS